MHIDPDDTLDLTSASDSMSDRNESSSAGMEKESLSNPEDTLDLPPLPSPMPSLSQLIRNFSTSCRVATCMYNDKSLVQVDSYLLFYVL